MGVALAEARLLPPVADPDKIICIGLNYEQARARERQRPARDAHLLPQVAQLPVRARARRSSSCRLSEKRDYEAEVAFVIGARCKGVPESTRSSVIAGYTLLNDLSARDFQLATPQWGPGKVWDGSAPWARRSSPPTRPGRPTPSTSGSS